jgi:hypothetical protein
MCVMMAVVHDLAEAQGTIDNPTRRRVAYNRNTHLFPSLLSSRAVDNEAGGASLGGHAKLRA